MIRTLLSAAALVALVGVGSTAMPSDAMAKGVKAGRCTSITEEIKRADCINSLAAQTSTDTKAKKAKKKRVSKKKTKKTSS